ncbi:MAG: POTRA domain-containing protein [Acidobacteriota bacterium]
MKSASTKIQGESGIWRAISAVRELGAGRLFTVAAVMFFAVAAATAQNEFEHRPIGKIEIGYGTGEVNAPSTEPYRIIIAENVGTVYSATNIRDSIQALHNTGKVASVIVSADVNGASGVDLKYLINRKKQVEKVSIVVGNTSGEKITEQELMFKLNLLAPGTSFTEQNLQSNADQILDYLRAHGFYRSEVTFQQVPTSLDNSVGVVFNVTPNEQAKVEALNIKLEGYEKPFPPGTLSLEVGESYTAEKVTKDVNKIKAILRKSNFTAPEIDEPRVTYDSEKNAISIDIVGKVGPVVKVSVDAGKEKVGDSLQTRLLPIKSEGTLDYAAIIEGERQLETYLQERGYFFAEVTPYCSVEPQLDMGGEVLANNTEFLCSTLGSSDLANKTVAVVYKADKKFKLRLVSIRLRGTGKLPIDEIRTVLESQEANALGFIPLFGYGNGFTSVAMLERDAATIKSLMNEIGYRDAQVHVNQGVSPNGQDLIITFVVDEGPPTVVDNVAVTGNTAIPTDVLLAQIPDLSGANYSRARTRNAVRKLAEFYSNKGYYDARVTSSIIEQKSGPLDAERKVKLEFKVDHEGKKVIINRVLVTGNEATKEKAILRALPLKKGALLKSSDVYLSEQNLYGTDAFDRVEIKPEPAGNTATGERLTDVVVSVNEQPPRLINYGGGFSTDDGANGFFDIRHVNLLGNLWQGGARFRGSRLQQLVQLDFVNPRFMRDGEKKFAPLTFSAQFQRDSTVTRFFRSAFDKGTFGIVQRIDAKGNPIDQFGDRSGNPTLNRLSLSVETNKTLSIKDRAIIFAKYRFEDVRLSNIESLLVKDVLRPDQRIRISGPSMTLVRDTRENCSVKTSLLELIAKGEAADKCKYSASDPTRGNYLTVDYSLSLRTLGANVGFHKFQANYRTYYTFPGVRNLTLASQLILGLGHVFSSSRPTSVNFPDLAGILPISERFFAGGSTTLRGFDFEEAGPRVVIVPVGTFLNSKRQPVTLQPFTIPFGGNALAVVNLEARIPVSKSIRLVPFYDGGNVFRRVSEIFNPTDVPPNDVFKQNLRALWTHTAGLGLRLKTPIGGEFGVDYGYLLNPPSFLIPQVSGPNANLRLHQGQFHFHFAQAF